MFFLSRTCGTVVGNARVSVSLIRPSCEFVTTNESKGINTFKGFAEVGKSTMGWFFGFKLHLIINDKGEILSFYLSKGNVDDRDLKTITNMTKEIFGKLFGDRG